MSKNKTSTIRDHSNLASPMDRRDDSLYIGQPGYRNRRGRSGLDYIETQAEFGHSMGALIRRLLTGKMRVRNPFYLFFLGLVGVMFCLPGFLWLAELVSSPFNNLSIFTTSAYPRPGFSLLTGGLAMGVIVALTGLIGVLLLVNVGRNLYRRLVKKQRSRHNGDNP